MAPFTFDSIQSLCLSREDNPAVDIHNDEIVITAERNGERIVITAPLPGIVHAPVAQTTVKTTKWQKPFKVKRNMPKGEDHTRSKLTEKDVKEMRAMYADPSIMRGYANRHEFFNEVGKAYGVHFTTVSKIINRRSWTHI